MRDVRSRIQSKRENEFQKNSPFRGMVGQLALERVNGPDFDCLVMGTLRASRQQAATCSCKKRKRKKSPKKWQPTESKWSGCVKKLHRKKKWSHLGVALRPRPFRNSVTFVPSPKRLLNSMMTVSRTLTPHARTRFENLVPKYLYQEIFVNFCLALIRTEKK